MLHKEEPLENGEKCAKIDTMFRMQALKAQADQSLASLESTLPQNESQTDAEAIVAERETKGKVLSPSLISSQHLNYQAVTTLIFFYIKSQI